MPETGNSAAMISDSMEKISVALAGPWWNALTYLAPRKYPEGVRVRVPVGNGGRVGIVLGGYEGEDDYGGELKDISAVIDSEPILPRFMMPMIRWFSETYLCGFGTAMKTLLPVNFLAGDALERDAARPQHMSEDGGAARPDLFLYEPRDPVRLDRCAQLLSDGLPSLICFPVYDAAKAFADRMGGRAFLYPRSGAAAEWRAWNTLLSGDTCNVVIGGQAAAVAPVPGLARIIVEDESNNAWRTLRPPVFNVRSLLSKRARIEGASLVLAGRMPSSRAYRMLGASGGAAASEAEARSGGGKNFLFVDMRLAYSPSVKGVQDTLAVSEPLVRETEAAINRGSWTLWILDRKGYAGEILCEECGGAICCAKCGGAMRWEISPGPSGRLVCGVCRAHESVPVSCPNCSGRLLTAKRPGLEALLPLARSALTGPVPILMMTGDDKAPLRAAPGPGLVIGTRAALSFCDLADVGLVGWIDVDGEARSQEYDARARAFGLVWESRWRDMVKNTDDRRVLLQTRRPGREWQRGLVADRPSSPGWAVFWRDELRERAEFSMPPFASLVKIEASAADARPLTASFDASRLEYWLSDS
ncbi:MAG: hypothetical protein LBL73_12570, partial [Synergistaceae bacterium]|nr:hypothetical protein [Synergistaceae bacterium]